MTISYINQQVFNYSSGTPTVTDTRTIDIGTRTKGMLGVIVNVIAMPASSGDVTSITWNGVALDAKAVEIGPPPYSSDIWYELNPTGGSHDLVTTFSGSGAFTYQIIVFWVDSDNDLVLGNTNTVTAGSTDPTSISVDSTVSGALVVSGFSTADNNVPSTSDTTIGSLWDQGGNCAGGSYLVAGTAGTQTMDWDRAAAGQSGNFNLSAAVFEEVGLGDPPSVVLDTANASTFNTGTPTVAFTGTDPDGDAIQYNAQITDNPDEWVGGVLLGQSLTSGAGTVIHTNPVAGTTWEGKQQIDDRLCQVFKAKGGHIDRIEWYFGPHETTPALTDGQYLCRLYNVEGYPVDTVPAAWAASTAYSLDHITRPTSTANVDVHYVYKCTTAGTSGSTEPTWPLVPGNTVNDGSAVWECLLVAGPANRADPADTPTPGWIAQSTVYDYAPGVADSGWKVTAFTGDERIRLTAGEYYAATLDWWPNSSDTDNTLSTTNASLANATAPGNVYLDGASINNNGPRIIEDSWIKVYEEFVLLDEVSGTDAGFANVDTPADTSPFNSGDQIEFTVQAGDELPDGIYYWRVSGLDPDDTNTYGDWATARYFTISSATVHELTVNSAAHSHLADQLSLVGILSAIVNGALHTHVAESATLTALLNTVVNDSAQAQASDNVVVTLIHSLTSNDASHAQAAETPTLSRITGISANDALHGLNSDAPALSAIFSILPADAAHVQVADQTTLTASLSLVVSDALHTSVVDSPIVQIITSLLVADAGHTIVSDAATLQKLTQIVASDSGHTQSVDAPVLSVLATLVAASALHVTFSDEVSFEESIVLTVDSALHSITSDNTTITKIVSAVIDSALHSMSAETPVFVKIAALSAADAFHSQTSDQTTLTKAVALAASDASHVHVSDQASLTKLVSLTAADASHVQVSEQVSITKLTSLVSSDAIHQQAADLVTVARTAVMIVDSASHDQISEAILIYKTTTITADGTIHSHSVDSVVFASEQDLVVYSAAHSITSDVPSLFVATLLTINDAQHSIISDEAGVTLLGNVAPDSSLHTHTADMPDVTRISSVTVDSSAHIIASDSPLLSRLTEITPDAATHALVSEQPSLSAVVGITADDAAHTISSDDTVLTKVTTIAPDRSILGLSSDNVLLVRVAALSVDDSNHQMVSDALALALLGVLSVDDATHVVVSDAPSIAKASTLTVSDAAHVLSSDFVLLIDLEGRDDILISIAINRDILRSVGVARSAEMILEILREFTLNVEG